MVFFVACITIIATQWHGKYTSATIEELCFLRGPYQGVILRTTGATERVLNGKL
jgi:hypothetical protein